MKLYTRFGNYTRFFLPSKKAIARNLLATLWCVLVFVLWKMTIPQPRNSRKMTFLRPQTEEVNNNNINTNNNRSLLSARTWQNCGETVTTVILVTSAASHFEPRDRQRKEFQLQNASQNYQMTYRFLLGQSFDQVVSEKISEEIKTYNDIVMGNFEDQYRNLTLKSILCLEWATLFCSQARFVIKTDDDMSFNLSKLHRYLSNLTIPSDGGFVLGTVANSLRRPFRNADSKWYISPEDYKENVFPTYAFGGAYLFAGENTARKLWEATRHVKYLTIEDVYITGICRIQAGVDLVDIRVIHLSKCVDDGFFCEVLCRQRVPPNAICPFVHRRKQ